jgi:hypothetical protein
LVALPHLSTLGVDEEVDLSVRVRLGPNRIDADVAHLVRLLGRMAGRAVVDAGAWASHRPTVRVVAPARAVFGG